MRSAAFAFLLISIAIFHFGCAKSTSNQTSAARSGNYYAVTPSSADFFHYGPQQGTGPDRKLPRDTLVTLVHRMFGYAQVKLISGEEGYVSLGDLRIAPPELIAAVLPTPTPRPVAINYPEPKLPTADAPPGFEPTPIPAPSASPH